MKHRLIKGLVATAALVMSLSIHAFAFETVNMTLVYDGIAHIYSAPEIFLVIDGREIRNMPMPPVIIDDYTMVPAREVFEQLGAFVDWNASTREVYIAYDRDLVVLQLDNKVAYLNETPIVMEAAPKVINEKTMIPVRFAAEALGFKVGWSAETRIVSIDYALTATEPVVSQPVITDNPSATELEITDTLEEPAINKDDIVSAIDVSKSTLTSASYPSTTIDAIELLEGGSKGITVKSSSEISRVNKILLADNRLILDFYDAELNVATKEYEATVSSGFSKVRVAQNQLEPELITRVVLDLKNGVNFSVSMAADRKSVSVDFEKNNITDVSFHTDSIYDYITITGSKTPAVDISSLSNPERLVVDMPYSSIAGKDSAVHGRFATAVSNAQFEANTARVVIDLNGRVKHTVSYNQNTVTIKLEEPTYKNISYDNTTRTITLAKLQALSAAAIGHEDKYSNGQYILTLPGNYLSVYGYGDYAVNDAYLSSINIDSTAGNTKITIHENEVFVAIVTEDNANIYIQLKNPKQVYSKVVVLDPGHGGSDPGTSGSGIQEKAITLDVSNRVIAMLEANYGQTGIKVYATRTADTYISRFDRAPYANKIGDLFVSVHINSASPNEAPNGTETYYHPHNNDSTIGITTQQTADIFHKHLLSQLEFADRKVKEDTYTVLLDTSMPSVLCELGFISNPEEAAKLISEEYKQKAAQALYNSIVETFSAYMPAR